MIEVDEKFMLDHGLTTWGSYNDTPRPYRKCDISEFWRTVSHYGVRETEHRQLLNFDDNPYSFYYAVHVFVYHDRIYMIHIDKQYNPVCWKVGCEHDYEHSSANCTHHYKCRICGYSYNVDSSG